MDFEYSDASPVLQEDTDWLFNAEVTTQAPAALRRVSPPDFGVESVLVESLKAGDDAAFNYLVFSESERMHSVARRFFHEDEDARDAVQEAFLAAYRAIDRFEGQARLSTWLHRVVVNACLMKLRSRRRKPEQSLDDASTATLVAHTSEDAHQVLENDEVTSRVHAAIADLPEPHQSVLRLRDLEERDTRETAIVLDISPAAVKTRLHRARTALRTRLMDGGGRWESQTFLQSA